MPAKNSIKVYVNDSFYHIYNRGNNKQPIFLDETDYFVFLSLLKRYLAPEAEKQNRGGMYPNFSNDVELVAYCLMPNHFHLLLYQLQDNGITEFMRSLCTSYSMYFNKKYGRVGTLFQGKFKASRVNQDAYLHHISRYIHLNPSSYRSWPYSSYTCYRGTTSLDWVKSDKILELFDYDKEKYLKFVSDYEEQKQIMDELKYELANE